MLLFPKPVRKEKRRKSIPRRSKFKVANESKKNKLKDQDKIIAFAELCRAQQIANNNPAEISFQSILEEIGIKYKYQEIIYRTGSFIICDFVLDEYNICIEIDGGGHASQGRYDRKRDTWLFQHHSIETRRIPNHLALNKKACKIHLEELIRTWALDRNP